MPAPAVAPSQGDDTEDDYAPVRTHQPQPQSRTEAKRQFAKSLKAQQPKQPKSQHPAAAAAGGTGESQHFCESESDEAEEKRDEAAVAEPLSMSPVSTDSLTGCSQEGWTSPDEETRAHPKDMHDYPKEAMENLCDDEQDSMTRASNIGDRIYDRRHQTSKRQKVTSDTQRDSVPDETPKKEKKDETPRGIDFHLNQKQRPIFRSSTMRSRSKSKSTTTQYIEAEYVGNAASSASSSSAAVEVVEPQPNRKRRRSRSRPQQRRTRSRSTRSGRTRSRRSRSRRTRSNDEADRSRGSEAPDSHLCKYQSYDVAAMVQRAARCAKDAEENYVGTTAETTTPQNSPTDTSFNIANWVVGQITSTQDMCSKLERASWSVVVIVFSTAVAAGIAKGEPCTIARWFARWLVWQKEFHKEFDSRDQRKYVGLEHDWGPEAEAVELQLVMREKLLLKFTDDIYLVIARHKVEKATLQLFSREEIIPEGADWPNFSYQLPTDSAPSNLPKITAVAESGGMILGTLTLELSTKHQGLTEINVGLLDMRQKVTGPPETKVEQVCRFIKAEHITVLTGHFAGDKGSIQQIAQQANAVMSQPAALFLTIPNKYDRRAKRQLLPATHNTGALNASRFQKDFGQCFTIPGYFMIFGRYRKDKIVDKTQYDIPAGFELGDDMWAEIVDKQYEPCWPLNQSGAHYAPYLGDIKMLFGKDGFERWWFHGVFQTCLWLGKTIPSKKNRERWQQAEKIAMSGGQHADGLVNRWAMQLKGKGGKGRGKGKGGKG